jgi:pyruvate ferredoxin oxidoreductase alpha subunit
MREQLEGSQAVAQVIARCRPQVVPAYPITPQTHIVEALGRYVATGELTPCAFITVESEFAAMSAAIGAAAAGSRSYTATASQGLLYMSEAVFNAAGLGLPIVMTVANRAIGAPINIWNDHSDSMSQRDCGWVQLHASDNQRAVDLHILAFALAQDLSLPVMVCMDGFVLTHAFEAIDVPSQADVDSVLPPFEVRQRLDPDRPVSIGAMVGPDAFTEVRYLAAEELDRARTAFGPIADRLAAVTGRSLAPFEAYQVDGAQTVVLSLGSIGGTVRAAIDGIGERIGVIDLTLFRPFPDGELRQALSHARRVVVIERAVSPGSGGIVSDDVRRSLWGLEVDIHTVIAGLGGRSVGINDLQVMLAELAAGRLGALTFLQLRHDVVDPRVRVRS